MVFRRRRRKREARARAAAGVAAPRYCLETATQTVYQVALDAEQQPVLMPVGEIDADFNLHFYPDDEPADDDREAPQAGDDDNA